MEGYLDQRLIGRQFTIKARDLLDGVTFFGIFYHLRATTSLHVGDLVEVTHADAYRMKVLNTALSQSSENYFIFQNIEAFKALAKSDTNTVVMPNQTIDSLGLIPALTKLGKITTK